MNKAAKKYEVDLVSDLKDPEEAAAYLNAALLDGDHKVFLLALRDVAAARGLKNLANHTSLNRENMYRMLSREGNPNFSSLTKILDSLGLVLSIKTKQSRASSL